MYSSSHRIQLIYLDLDKYKCKLFYKYVYNIIIDKKNMVFMKFVLVLINLSTIGWHAFALWCWLSSAIKKDVSRTKIIHVRYPQAVLNGYAS